MAVAGGHDRLAGRIDAARTAIASVNDLANGPIGTLRTWCASSLGRNCPNEPLRVIIS